MIMLDFLKGVCRTLSRVRHFRFKYFACLRLAIFSALILWGIVVMVNGEEFIRLYLGPQLTLEPGPRKVTGLGEFHWGYESKEIYLALAMGVGSKSLLSSNLLKSLDMIEILNSLVQPENEFYFGAALEYVIFHKDWSPELRFPIAGGPKVHSGWGCGVRIESTLNLYPKKSEKDPFLYSEIGIYPNIHFATKLMAIRPMVGIGYNDRLDYHFVKKELSGIERDFISRWKFRVDLSTQKFIKIGNSNFLFFISVQHEKPMKKTSMLQLEDGTLAKAPLLRETSVRLGISIDISTEQNVQKATKPTT